MTLEEIKNSDKLFLTPDDVAPVLGSNPHTVRCTARQRPDLLGFKFTEEDLDKLYRTIKEA